MMRGMCARELFDSFTNGFCKLQCEQQTHAIQPEQNFTRSRNTRHSRVHKYTLPYTQPYTHTHTHTNKQTHTHTHTDTHILNQSEGNMKVICRVDS